MQTRRVRYTATTAKRSSISNSNNNSVLTDGDRKLLRYARRNVEQNHCAETDPPGNSIDCSTEDIQRVKIYDLAIVVTILDHGSTTTGDGG
jgi:hypothetical protein